MVFYVFFPTILLLPWLLCLAARRLRFALCFALGLRPARFFLGVALCLEPGETTPGETASPTTEDVFGAGNEGALPGAFWQESP
jgi:hypothetical protein